MDRNYFNTAVRPNLTEVPIGKQGVAFDRLELDVWAEEHKHRNGRPGRPKGGREWDARERRALSKGMVPGTSTNASAGVEFARALEQLGLKKRRSSSPD